MNLFINSENKFDWDIYYPYVTRCIIHIHKNKSFLKSKLDCKGTHKETKNPLGIKTYLVGLNYDAKLSYKKWSQKIKTF